MKKQIDREIRHRRRLFEKTGLAVTISYISKVGVEEQGRHGLLRGRGRNTGAAGGRAADATCFPADDDEENPPVQAKRMRSRPRNGVIECGGQNGPR